MFIAVFAILKKSLRKDINKVRETIKHLVTESSLKIGT